MAAPETSTTELVKVIYAVVGHRKTQWVFWIVFAIGGCLVSPLVLRALKQTVNEIRTFSLRGDLWGDIAFNSMVLIPIHSDDAMFSKPDSLDSRLRGNDDTQLVTGVYGAVRMNWYYIRVDGDSLAHCQRNLHKSPVRVSERKVRGKPTGGYYGQSYWRYSWRCAADCKAIASCVA